jgi:hypothetical protein
MVKNLLDLDQNYVFCDVFRWEDALPFARIGEEFMQERKSLEEMGLYFAGDYLLGKGRVLYAMDSGI